MQFFDKDGRELLEFKIPKTLLEAVQELQSTGQVLISSEQARAVSVYKDQLVMLLGREFPLLAVKRQGTRWLMFKHVPAPAEEE